MDYTNSHFHMLVNGFYDFGVFYFCLWKNTKIVCVNLIFLILLSPQFAELTPIGEDGWWFISIAEREFGIWQ